VGNYCKAILKFTTFFLSQRKDFQIVHMHGFSLKSLLLVLLSRLLNKKVIIKMTSVGHDDPVAMRQRGFLLNYFFSKADAYVGMSPLFDELYRQSQLPSNRLKQIPNGVDTSRFSPVTVEEKSILRNELGLPNHMELMLFVGHFSREKCPDMLLEAWIGTIEKTLPTTGLVFVGSTNPDHYEVDTQLVEYINHLSAPFIDEYIFFIEKIHATEKVYKAVDMFVLPSLREGLPNALLEAMACGLPVIVSRLEGVTDWVVTDGMNGLLVEPGNQVELGIALSGVLRNEKLASLLGDKARRTVIERFSMTRVAEEYGELYGDLVAQGNKFTDASPVSD
jgi:glycosyltransferase involved in cell wall biosynthesis